MNFSGRVWKFGDDINTDLIAPGKWLAFDTKTISSHTLEPINPQFASQVKPGEIVMGGKNFGGGSSREAAVRIFKELQVSCILAQSFARIFYRNAIALGFPVLVIPHEFYQETVEGDLVKVEMTLGELVRPSAGKTYHMQPLPEKVLSVLSAGGILPLLKKLAQDGA